MDRASVAAQATAMTERASEWWSAHPEAGRASRSAGLAGLATLLGLFAFGVLMLATMLTWPAVAAAAVLLALLPIGLHRIAGECRVARVAGILPFVIVIPLLSLLGFNVLWAAAPLPRPPIGLGLLIAAIVLTAAAYVYVRWLGAESPPRSSAWALAAGCAALGTYVITGWRAPTVELVATAAATSLGIWIYLRRRVGPNPRHPLLWAVWLATAWVVVVPVVADVLHDGHLNLALLVIGTTVTLVALAGRLVLSDGSARPTWRFAGTMLATTTGVPLFAALVALIWVDPPRDRPTVPIARAAAATPLPAMALAHRPFLLFDGDEGLRTPLDVDRLLATEQVALCPGDEGSLPVCLTLRGASDLRNGVGNLRFDTGEIEADAEIDTTIYVNVARHATEPGVVYLDYWWYLIDNPADTARGAMCGAGLVIPDITCFDHQSDWEGVTVVAKDPGGEPVAVQYAAHDRIVRVPWGVLQTAWAKPKMRKHTVSRDVSAQPLVFIARGTHAAYPMPCTDEPCSTDTVSPEKRHDGTYAWPERPCGGDCVAPFPATGTGSPASWNAFDGRWGTAVCVLDDLCARAKAPVAPGRQARFKAPWCYSHVVVRDTGTLTPVKGAFKRCKRAAGV